ncbi:hypothetical protein ARSEF1564_009564 [Beauveria bassiana]
MTLPLSNIAENRPVHRRSIFEIVQALLHAINHNQAEVATCVAALSNSVPLIYSVLPAAEPGSLPTPPAQQALPVKVVHTTDESSTSDEPPNPPENSPAKSKEPDNAYKRAVAIVNRLPLELGSVNVLSELQYDL